MSTYHSEPVLPYIEKLDLPKKKVYKDILEQYETEYNRIITHYGKNFEEQKKDLTNEENEDIKQRNESRIILPIWIEHYQSLINFYSNKPPYHEDACCFKKKKKNK